MPFDQPGSGQPIDHHGQQPVGPVVDGQPVTELAEHRVVEARILELQTQGILPINSTPDSISCLAVRKILNKLKHGDQC